MKSLLERLRKLHDEATPGPWQADHHYPVYLWGPEKKMIADTPSGKDEYLLRMRGTGDRIPIKQQAANLRLCAELRTELAQIMKVMEAAELMRRSIRQAIPENAPHKSAEYFIHAAMRAGAEMYDEAIKETVRV